MSKSFYSSIDKEVENIRNEGLFKEERHISSPQQTEINLIDGQKVLNFCANDYLGLANNDEIKKAARDTLETDGFGMASVRFICGTNDLHQKLEKRLSKFLGYEDCILYVACFDANGGLHLHQNMQHIRCNLHILGICLIASQAFGVNH